MTRRLRLPLGIALGIALGSLLGIPFGHAAAQGATFAGAVVRDTLSHGISGALVSIPMLNRSDTTDARGEFKMTGLPAGRYAALIRSIGFKPMVDTILLTIGGLVDREYVMDANPVALDSVRVNAKREEHLSPRMAQFEDHRKSGTGGTFVTDSVLRKNESRNFGDVLTSLVPGLRLYRPDPKTRPTMEYLSSGRGACAGRAFSCNGAQECPVTLLMNGLVYFNAAIDHDLMNYPDMSGFLTQDYAAVEYYPGGASVPLQYNMTSSGCGVLVLWQREKI